MGVAMDLIWVSATCSVKLDEGCVYAVTFGLTSSMMLVLAAALVWGGWGAVLMISRTTVWSRSTLIPRLSRGCGLGLTVESVNVSPFETRVGTVPFGFTLKKSGLKFSP